MPINDTTDDRLMGEGSTPCHIRWQNLLILFALDYSTGGGGGGGGGGDFVCLSYSFDDFFSLGLFAGGFCLLGLFPADFVYNSFLAGGFCLPWIIRRGNLSPLDYSLFVVVVVVSLGFSLGDLFCLGLFAGGFYLPWLIRRGILPAFHYSLAG